jgi:hypothetical protein
MDFMPMHMTRLPDTLATCCACRFLRHFVPQSHDLWVVLGVFKVKNRLIGDFLMFFAQSATNSQAAAV